MGLRLGSFSTHSRLRWYRDRGRRAFLSSSPVSARVDATVAKCTDEPVEVLLEYGELCARLPRTVTAVIGSKFVFDARLAQGSRKDAALRDRDARVVRSVLQEHGAPNVASVGDG